MAKSTTVFVCSECGGESLRWAGQCRHCHAWNTLEEMRAPSRRSAVRSSPRSAVMPLTEVGEDWEERQPLRWSELNRVLGGGIVGGSVVLLGGEPGVGKSTLLMHVAEQLSAAAKRVLYVSGEESAHQVRMRAQRLQAVNRDVLLLAETDLEAIVAAISAERPALAIVDSIQTVYDPGLEAAAGSVSQVREGAARLMRLAKSEGVPICLVGHVTKEGMIAGPRVLEHLVDTVLYLEGDRQHEFRILRATKNRFGSTEEIGVFAMGEDGLVEVPDPSGYLLEARSLEVEGTVVTATMEGSRPLLVELQSLVTPTPFGLPRRASAGVDVNRLQLIIAVLEKRAGVTLGSADVFVNVAGGIRIAEPGADLALALTLVSNVRDRPLGPGLVAIGELGLTGEVRRVGQLERRLQEAARRGFRAALVPAQVAPSLQGIELIPVSHLREAVDKAFQASSYSSLSSTY